MKKRFLLFVLITIVLFPINVFAYEMYCNDGEYAQGDEFTCYFKIEERFMDTTFDVFKGTIKSTDNLSCALESRSGGYEDVTPENPSDFNFTGATSTTVAASFKCKVVKDGENLESQVTMDNFQYHILDNPAPISKENVRSDFIKVISKEKKGETERVEKPRGTTIPDSRLKTLKDPQLKYTFSTFVTEYEMEVLYEVENLNLEIVTQNPDATYTVKKEDADATNEIKLELGKNVIDVFVTSPDGTSITCYTLTITRLSRGQEIYEKDKDASLKALIVKGFEINFDKSIKEYNIHLDANTSNILVTATPNSPSATVSVKNSDKLVNGSVVSVEIISGDKSVTDLYKINITKDAPKKDYSGVIYTVLVILAIIGVVVLFVLVAQKKQKSDPLLKIKHSKRKMNKGKKFDASQVSEVGSQGKKVENVDEASIASAQDILNQNQAQVEEQTPSVPATAEPTELPQVPVPQAALIQNNQTATPAPVVVQVQETPAVPNPQSAVSQVIEESAMPVMPAAPQIQEEEPAFISDSPGIPQVSSQSMDVPALPADMMSAQQAPVIQDAPAIPETPVVQQDSIAPQVQQDVPVDINGQ